MTLMEEYGGYNMDNVYDWNLEEQFQDYRGQKVVIINEYKGPHQIAYGTLLKMIDKWPYSVKRKGLGTVPFVAELVIITSVFDPTEIDWNLSVVDNLDKLLRRVEVITVKDRKTAQ